MKHLCWLICVHERAPKRETLSGRLSRNKHLCWTTITRTPTQQRGLTSRLSTRQLHWLFVVKLVVRRRFCFDSEANSWLVKFTVNNGLQGSPFCTAVKHLPETFPFLRLFFGGVFPFAPNNMISVLNLPHYYFALIGKPRPKKPDGFLMVLNGYERIKKRP